MKTSPVHLLLVLAVLVGVAGSSGCKCAGGACEGDLAGNPKVALGGQSDAGTVMAMFPNPCEIDIDFGAVPIGKASSATILIENVGDGVLDLGQLNPALDPEFSLSYSTPSPIGPGHFAPLFVA